MRACFLLDHFWGERHGGAEWQTFVLGRALREEGWEVHFIAESLTAKRGTTAEAFGIRVHWLSSLQWRSRFFPSQRQMYERIRRILNEIKPDVLYSRGNNCFTGIGVCHRYRRETRSLCVWGAAADWEISRRFYRDRLRGYPKPPWKRVLLWVDAYIKDRDHAAEIAEADCVCVQTLQQGELVTKRFGKDSYVLPSSHEVPAESAAKSATPIAIFVAHIGRRKRVELFLETARQCQNMTARFIVLGDFSDAEYESEIRRKAEGLKNIEFLGPAPAAEANARIAESTILISTTDPGREGYPNVFIQAWMRKTPVVSLEHDPDGVIAGNQFLGRHAGTMENLIAQTRALLSNPSLCAEMGRSARRWAIERHSYESNRAKIAALFNRLAKAREV